MWQVYTNSMGIQCSRLKYEGLNEEKNLKDIVDITEGLFYIYRKSLVI
jgi:hypothetical protein